MEFRLTLDEGSLRQVQREVNTRIKRAIAKSTIHAIDEGVATAKLGGFKDRTGKLRIQIRGVIEGWNGDTYSGFIWSPMHYSSFVEYPTKPHDIHPKAGFELGRHHVAVNKGGKHAFVQGRGRFLRWTDAGGEHFARMVHHPGTAGFFFMRYAEQVARRRLVETIWSSLRQA